MIILIMGVAGSGKTTVGRALAASLGWLYVDGDDFHSPAAIEKMRAEKPLDDSDRTAWLGRIRRFCLDLLSKQMDAVISCSALKKSYREFLASGINPGSIRFIYLDVGPDVARARMHQRLGHFMPPSLLSNQFETLEPPSPDEALWVDAELSVPQIVSLIRSGLRRDRVA